MLEVTYLVMNMLHICPFMILVFSICPFMGLVFSIRGTVIDRYMSIHGFIFDVSIFSYRYCF
jgi:ABC-type methionine transport system permease subunit